MTVPNLFIVGAPKCGTTAWVEYLSGHPQVYFAPLKEPHYFSEDFPDFRWVKTPEDYAELFRNAGVARVAGEASVQYLYSTVAARRISEFNPAARVLVFLRNQSTFLPSYHNQLLYNRDETIRDFAKVWRMALRGGRKSVPASCRSPAFLDYPAVGRFDEQLERYLDVFPASQIMVLRYECWTRDPREAYRQVLDFLGLDDDGRMSFDRVHAAKRHRSNVLAQFTQRPPGWALALSRELRRLTGRSQLGLAQMLRSANAAAGYSTNLSDDVRAELAEYYSESNRRLGRMLDRGGVRLFRLG